MIGNIETAHGEPAFGETSIRAVHHRCCAVWHDDPDTALAIRIMNEAGRIWRLRQPVAGTAAERYLRVYCRYSGPIPECIGFLPPDVQHGPAIIALFGGETAEGDIAGVLIQPLLDEGHDAFTLGEPIHLIAPCNYGAPIDLWPSAGCELAVTISIEDAVVVHAATGIAAIAAGDPAFMALMELPEVVRRLKIFVHDDGDEREAAKKLAARTKDLARQRGERVSVGIFVFSGCPELQFRGNGAL